VIAYCRGNRIHCARQIVRLATQQDDIIGPFQLTMLNCLRRRANFAILSLYDQAVALELGSARGPYKKGDVGAAFNKLGPEISPERAGA
jgi:hypothetical protein